MKRELFFAALVATIFMSCSKTDNTQTGNISLLGGWQSDSSIYQGYNDNRLVKQEVDRDDESELEAKALYFFDDGTFRYYYISLETPGKRDTLEMIRGNYRFNAATKELILEDQTRRETSTVILLDEEKLVYRITVNNPQSPDPPEINKEVISFYLSKIQ